MAGAPLGPADAGPPDVGTVVPWRDLPDGLAEAERRDRPVLLLAEPAWSNAAQRLALVLGRDEEARRPLDERIVPVRVDPLRRPDLAGSLRHASVALTGSAGPPLIAFLTPEGRPFLAYPTIRPEGDDAHPSLAALLRSVADLHDERPEALREEARALAAGDDVPPAPRAWSEVAGRTDGRFGGLDGLPKRPEPALLWSLTFEEDPAARAHLRRTLDAMARGGILDQLAGSFHRASRDERWVVPHFEKTVPGNAALAAVYARAGERFDDEAYRAIAAGAARFAVAGLDEGAIAVASDPGYYTWTPDQVADALDPAHLQALGLHVNITRHPSPHTLFRAMEPAEMTEWAHEPAHVLAERVKGAKEHLRFARLQRHPPAVVTDDAPAWRAETLRWSFRALAHGVDLDGGTLLAHLDALLERPYVPGAGYGRRDGDGGEDHWLEDQAALAAACVEAFRVRDHRPALDAARRLADLILEAYRTPDAERLTDRPAGRPGAAPSRSLSDHDLPAAVPTTIGTLRELARLGGERAEAWARAADRLATAHRPGRAPARGTDAAGGSTTATALGEA